MQQKTERKTRITQRTIHIPLDLIPRVDALVAMGATLGNVVSECLRRALPSVEKDIQRSNVSGLRVRFTR
jgi:hypothetical protein